MTPIVGRMRSGIHFFRWARHFMWEVGSLGRKDAWICTRSGGIQVLTLGYRGNILHKLEVIQATTTLLVQPGIKLRGQLRVDRAKGEGTVQRTMMQTYAEVRNMEKALKVPSESI